MRVAAPRDEATRPDRLTLLAFLGVVLFGGVNAVAAKQTVAELDPFWAGGLRFVLAGLIMAAIVFLTGRAIPRGRSLSGAAMYGALFAVSFGAAYPALREAPAGTAAVFIAMVPLVTLGLAVAHRLETFRVQGLLGGLVAVVGIAIVFADQISADVPIGALVLFSIAVVSIAEMGVVVKMIPRSDPFHQRGRHAHRSGDPAGRVVHRRRVVGTPQPVRDLGGAGLPGRPRLGSPVRAVRLCARALDRVGRFVFGPIAAVGDHRRSGDPDR